ncbi:MAG TPA: N-methyl-L-tryptophan oxidase [Gemmataceae bacterium]|jgi:sarcosine oxidase
MYDVIVLGLGGMGAAAAAELARRGRRVLGLEQFSPAHDRGSSHGHTRVIRTAYFEHPAYVPLVRRAFRLWHELEQRTGRHLLTACPCLSIGPPGGELVQGVRRAAREHGLAVEDLDPAGLVRRFPLFRFNESYVGLLEQDAGFVYVERAVKSFAADALARGATLRWEEPVRAWDATDAGVTVRTDRDTYQAGRLVIAAGAWATSLLGRLGAKLTVMRQVPVWLAPPDPRPFARDRFPIYLADTPEGTFYGLPAIDPRGHKVAQHYGAPELPGPETVDRTVTDADEAPVRAFVRAHLPGADGPRTAATVCLYTLTPDRHFVIDRHPEHATVAVAAGFSGHGFKFAPVVGELLADLAETGMTDGQTELFRIGRLRRDVGQTTEDRGQ